MAISPQKLLQNFIIQEEIFHFYRWRVSIYAFDDRNINCEMILVAQNIKTKEKNL